MSYGISLSRCVFRGQRRGEKSGSEISPSQIKHETRQEIYGYIGLGMTPLPSLYGSSWELELELVDAVGAMASSLTSWHLFGGAPSQKVRQDEIHCANFAAHLLC